MKKTKKKRIAVLISNGKVKDVRVIRQNSWDTSVLVIEKTGKKPMKFSTITHEKIDE
jgi:hypothetical protein